MKRTAGIERLYFLGDFKNVKVTSVITDIPEEIAQDETAIDLIQRINLISCDKTYQLYKEMTEQQKASGEDVLTWLENQRVINYEALKTLINDKETE